MIVIIATTMTIFCYPAQYLVCLRVPQCAHDPPGSLKRKQIENSQFELHLYLPFGIWPLNGIGFGWDEFICWCSCWTLVLLEHQLSKYDND